jgi:hypothetical protein
MCSIVGHVGAQHAAPFLLDGLGELEAPQLHQDRPHPLGDQRPAEGSSMNEEEQWI